jgi:hypothetical protein
MREHPLQSGAIAHAEAWMYRGAAHRQGGDEAAAGPHQRPRHGDPPGIGVIHHHIAIRVESQMLDGRYRDYDVEGAESWRSLAQEILGHDREQGMREGIGPPIPHGDAATRRGKGHGQHALDRAEVEHRRCLRRDVPEHHGVLDNLLGDHDLRIPGEQGTPMARRHVAKQARPDPVRQRRCRG